MLKLHPKVQVAALVATLLSVVQGALLAAGIHEPRLLVLLVTAVLPVVSAYFGPAGSATASA